MSNIKAAFEKEVKVRLAQKAKPNQPEDVLLIKTIKYFDLNNSGTVSRDEFSKALIRLGINSYTEPQITELFKIYDEDASGELDYKEFASILFGTPRSPSKAGKRPTTATIPEPQSASSTSTTETKSIIEDQGASSVVQSLNSLKDILKKRGTTGIIGFARMFRVVDDNNNKKIEFEEFYKVLKDYQVDLPLVQVQKLFSYFDKDKSGTIDYDELLLGIRGELNSFRKTFVDKAFAKLDANGSGTIELDDIQGVYNASKHPDVIAGKKRETDILEEFLRTFESHSYYRGKKDNIITHEEFEDYYGFISASIDDDQYFATMMNSVWKLDQPSGGKFEESKSGQLVVDDYEQLQGNIGFTIKRLKQRLGTRGLRAILILHKILRDIDKDQDGLITQGELLKALKDNRLEVTEPDAQAIIEHYDQQNKGKLPYAKFVDDLLGNINHERREIVDIAWNTLNGSKDNKVDIGTLKSAFKGLRNHPDVKSGRKTDIQVTDEYNEAWDAFRSSMSRATTDYLTKQEFDKFMLCLSGIIEDDQYFEATIVQTFKIKRESQQKNWAGMTGGRKDYDPKQSYVQDLHRSLYQGGNVTSAAPWGTSQEHFNPYQEPQSVTPKKPNKFEREEEKPKSRGQQQQAAPSQSQGIGEKDLFEYLRRKIIARGTRGILGIARLFKNIDDDNSKTLSFQEFDKALKDFRIDVVEEDAWKIFNYLDINKDGTINFEEFLRRVKGDMSENRKKLVIEVFERLDKDKNGFLTIDDIKDLYNAKQHPDVKTGKKSEDDVLMEFLETFEQHHAIMTNQGKDKKVSLAEFIEYYNNISCSIDDDTYFEIMMNNCWNTNRNYKKGWKAE